MKSTSSKKLSGFITGVLGGLVCLMGFILLTSTSAKQEVAGISITNQTSQIESLRRLSCSQCDQGGQQQLCLNANEKVPFSYCASATGSGQLAKGITCVACPADPAITPFPTRCHIETSKFCPMIACKIDETTGKSACPPCPKHIVCTTPKPNPVIPSNVSLTPTCTPKQVCSTYFGFHICKMVTSCNQ